MALHGWKRSKEFTCDYILADLKGNAFLPDAAMRQMVGMERPKSVFDLNLDVKIGKASTEDPITIWASLEESSITSGGLLQDRNDRRGWFQDRVEVTMQLEKHPELHRIADGPKTQNGTAHTSSSVSFSFGESANGGFFGGDPMGGVAVNVGVSSSHSFSRDLTEFKVVNNSDIHTIRHEYRMSASSGGAYEHPTDIVPSADDIGFTDSFRGIHLYSPPDLAVNNMPLLSQAVWQANHNNPVDESIMLTIQLKQHLVMADGENDFATVHSHASLRTITYNWHEKIPLHKLTGQVGRPL